MRVHVCNRRYNNVTLVAQIRLWEWVVSCFKGSLKKLKKVGERCSVKFNLLNSVSDILCSFPNPHLLYYTIHAVKLVE